ncbi:MAG: hypothetical protein ACTSU5_16365 [Promethearchaeota archaeon]
MADNLLAGARAYLSGPMDFIGSRIVEKYLGWRALLAPVLRALDIVVLDPWNKPPIRGHKDYGREKVVQDKSIYEKDFWTNPETRARFETDFWETIHIDLRMVDLSDLLIAFVPTNIYSVGTVHEIITARNQLKPTLVVSPPVKYELFPEIAVLPDEVKAALRFYGLKENPHGIPSQWYGNIVGGNYFFDGFGWEHLNFKEGDFFGELVASVLEQARPPAGRPAEVEEWERVKRWVDENEALRNLTGGVLDHVRFGPGEREMLEEAMDNDVERNRRYFWYNKPYKPKRPVLFQLFQIASGTIPTRHVVVPMLDEEGNITHESHEVVDDAWLLLSEDDD